MRSEAAQPALPPTVWLRNETTHSVLIPLHPSRSIQRTLDEQASEIAQRQDESDASRKKLVELSRDFKKNSSEVSVYWKVGVPSQCCHGNLSESAHDSSYCYIHILPCHYLHTLQLWCHGNLSDSTHDSSYCDALYSSCIQQTVPLLAVTKLSPHSAILFIG